MHFAVDLQNCFQPFCFLLTKNYLFKLYNEKIPLSLNYTSDEVTKDLYERSISECISIFQEIVLNTYRYNLTGGSTYLALPRLHHFMMQWERK